MPVSQASGSDMPLDELCDRTLLAMVINPNTSPSNRKAALAELRRVAWTGGPSTILLDLQLEIER